jgi:hypothetical protein
MNFCMWIHILKSQPIGDLYISDAIIKKSITDAGKIFLSSSGHDF